jgi:hypothetical protein
MAGEVVAVRASEGPAGDVTFSQTPLIIFINTADLGRDY